MRALAALALVGAALPLAACDMRPAHAEWRSQCVASHEQMRPTMTLISNGRGGTTLMSGMTTDTICDRYEPVCVAGKDGSTTCPAQGY